MSHSERPSSAPIQIAQPEKSKSTLRCVALPDEIRPYLESVDIVSSTPPVHTSGLMASSVAIGPLAASFHWMDDSESDECMCCHRKFNWGNGRHHCRVCGSLVCRHCSKEQDCPAKLVHDQPTTASVLWGRAQSTLNYISMWSTSSSSSSSSSDKNTASSATPQKGPNDVVQTRVCVDCNVKIEEQDTLRLYRLIEEVFEDATQYAETLDLRKWDGLESRNGDWRRLVCIFRQAMAQSQHFVTNPWIQGYRNTTDLQKKLQSLLLWANSPLFHGHYFYSYAWLNQQSIFEQYWPDLAGTASPIHPLDQAKTLPCQHMRCKIDCNADATLEMRMHTLFSKTHIQASGAPSLPLPLSLALMPTMLIRGIRDAFYLTCMRDALREHGAAYGAPLYFWLHSIVCTGSYLEQIGGMLPPTDLAAFIQSFRWGRTVCQAMRTCRGNLKHKDIRKLNPKPNVLLPGTHNMRVEELYLAKIKRTESSSSPYMLPCLLRNLDTQTVSPQILLIKHNQSMFNDWVSMALIKTCAHYTDEPVQTYHITPIGPHSGLVIIVPESMTIYEAAMKNSVFNILHAARPSLSVEALRTQFSSSLAFFTVLSCFLGWRDRIESNMMIHPGSGTLFHIDFEYLLDQAPFWKATLRKCSGSRGGGFVRSGDNMTMTSLIPPSAIEMIGGYESDFYRQTFRIHCNKFYSEFYKLRHVFYYATECLCFTPSKVGRLLSSNHQQFFRSLELTFLRGVIITPEARHTHGSGSNGGGGGGGGGGGARVPISPLVIEADRDTSWNLEGLFGKIHSVVQKIRALK